MIEYFNLLLHDAETFKGFMEPIVIIGIVLFAILVIATVIVVVIKYTESDEDDYL